jgi:hypothetical protein
MIETAEEVALVERLWKQMEEEKKAGYIDDTSYVEGNLCYRDIGVGNIVDGPNAIVYHLRETEDGESVWDIYNFETGVKETVEGDLAGLANASHGNFPLFN